MFDVFKSLIVSIKNFIKPPITSNYPLEVREIPKRYRGGTFGLSEDEEGNINCIACLLCQNICPSQIISITRGIEEKEMPDGSKKKITYPKEFILDLNACMKCEMCVQVCPADAIVMLPNVEEGYFSREELILDKEKLLNNWRKYKLSVWATGESLRAEQDPKRTESINSSEKSLITTSAKEQKQFENIIKNASKLKKVKNIFDAIR
ncbi:MAG: NADH-quinone oxidoreductase subunit I [candidate division WOR-3 bacterium]|nr:NADH-quinone oxidoreductase subunit I [candidate division WOR-3 bacterium]MCX7948326.1 NADH-quinone oxidoreductase subunit I [candidate division WOR-3 bacterium]MDW8150846.1 NADH-quinone oxidoreductase subunit I [candidate division WOR-3 bacterium]